MATSLLPASRGVGPLLQRDYWAVFADCRKAPADVMTHVREHFCELAPPALVEFTAPEGGLVLGAELDIRIRPGQRCCVRVVHDDAQSTTLGTLAGHPEAGRITFGAYRNTDGQVIFHIRSRARSSSVGNRVGFLVIGDAMQTNTWTDFIIAAAAGVGARVQGPIHADTITAEPLPEDGESMSQPTFRAVGN